MTQRAIFISHIDIKVSDLKYDIKYIIRYIYGYYIIPHTSLWLYAILE